MQCGEYLNEDVGLEAAVVGLLHLVHERLSYGPVGQLQHARNQGGSGSGSGSGTRENTQANEGGLGGWALEKLQSIQAANRSRG